MTQPNEIDCRAAFEAWAANQRDWFGDDSDTGTAEWNLASRAFHAGIRASAKSCHSGVATQEQLIRGARAIGNSMNELNHINRAKEIWDAFHTDKDVPIPISPHLSTQKDNTHIYK